ncbi:hypothetical protein ES703_105316 [subsurface metagenome]
MNQYLKTIGMGLAGKLIDFGVARLSSPHRTSPQERIEQINKTLETLESAPEVGQHWTTPPTAAPEPQNKASLAPAATIAAQRAETAAGSMAEPYPDGSPAISSPGAVDDEYCVGCGPNNHLAKAQSHIEEALRLSRGRGKVIPDIVAPRIQDAVAELGGYEAGDIKHMQEKAASTLKEILDDLAIQTRDLRNFLRYDISGLELGKGTIEDLETAATWVRKLRQLGYYSVMVEVGQKVKAGAMIESKEQITLEEAKKLAAEEAAKEVEKRWQSQEKT